MKNFKVRTHAIKENVEYLKKFDHNIEKHKIQMEAKAGSALVFDAMIFHRAGRNISKKDRVTMTNIYTYPFMKQQINLNTNIEDFAKDDEEKMKILGFFNKTVESVKKFRQIRLIRSEKNE